MKSYESQAKNIDEAIAVGLERLGVSISDVTIDILDEGSKGLFGLFGSKMAKVRLTLKENDMDDLMAALTSPSKKKESAPDKAEQKKPERKLERKPEKPEKAQEPVPSEKRPAAPKPVKKPQAEKKPEAPAQPKEKKPVVPAQKADPASDCGRAQEFLQTLTRLMDVPVEVHVKSDEEGNILVNLEGDSLGVLIGRRGETLDALQYLTSLCVNKGKEGYTRVTLDTENYRAKREEALTRLANRMASRAIKTGRRVSLEPMNPYERRIIHSALQSNDQVDTHSEGEEPNRHLVITLKKQQDKQQH